MKVISKNDVEQMVDLLDGSIKMSDTDLRSFIYDMRIAILKEQWDEDSFHGEKYADLKRQIEDLEDENTELKEEIDDLR